MTITAKPKRPKKAENKGDEIDNDCAMIAGVPTEKTLQAIRWERENLDPGYIPF